jgi:MYXO-CTERM domain-containing protein
MVERVLADFFRGERMSRPCSVNSPAGETLSRRQRHFVSCAVIAAGVTVLGLAERSHAAVVYSGPLSITGAPKTAIFTDFDTAATSTTNIPGWDVAISVASINLGTEFSLQASVQSSAGVDLGGFVGGGFSVSKLDAGVTVGPSSTFTLNTQPVFQMADSVNNFYIWNGGVTNKFLGIEFKAADGTLHYAWEELNVNATTVVPTVVGWAYESTPNTAIVTGDTGTAVPEPSSAATLGALALGAAGVRSRRRKGV